MQIHNHTDREQGKVVAFTMESDGKGGTERRIIAKADVQRRAGTHKCGGQIIALAEGAIHWAVCEKCGADV